MSNWDKENQKVFSSWGEPRVREMEVRHQPAIDFFLKFVEMNTGRFKGNSKQREEKPFILDVGCGSGYLLFSLVRTQPWILGFSKLKGVDISEEMVQLANQSLASLANKMELPPDAIQFIQSNVLDINFDTGTCTLISSLESIYYVSDIEGAMSMFYRMLVKGGSLLLMIEDGMFKSGDGDVDSKRMEVLEKEINVDTFHFFTIENYKNLAGKVGFQNTSVESDRGFIFMIFTK